MATVDTNTMLAMLGDGWTFALDRERGVFDVKHETGVRARVAMRVVQHPVADALVAALQRAAAERMIGLVQIIVSKQPDGTVTAVPHLVLEEPK